MVYIFCLQCNEQVRFDKHEVVPVGKKWLHHCCRPRYVELVRLLLQGEKAMDWKTDKTVERLTSLVKESVQRVELDDQVWYDVQNQGLEAECKALRLVGATAHHPLIHTLIRFN